jgi:hypothetical protein
MTRAVVEHKGQLKDEEPRGEAVGIKSQQRLKAGSGDAGQHERRGGER